MDQNLIHIQPRISMAIVIRDQLINPPTWFASFRELTMLCKYSLGHDVVVESEDPDPYYRWLRMRGGMDFVEEFVRPESEEGVRLDCRWSGEPTIVIDRIAIENLVATYSKIISVREPRRALDVSEALRLPHLRIA